MLTQNEHTKHMKPTTYLFYVMLSKASVDSFEQRL